MTPLPPGALKHLRTTLPPEDPDPFPHLATLTPDQLMLRRVEISGQLKNLELLEPFCFLITQITPRAAARPPRLVHMHQLAHGAQRHSVPERSLAA
jgi:hypothetical protein